MKKQTRPQVSVVVPVFNAAPYLAKALSSILNQTYEYMEIVAVNDGSTDDSLSILSAWAKEDKRIKILNLKKNQGPGKAANIGVKAAKGDFIARVDADDWIPLDRIEKQLKFLLSHPKVIVTGGQVELVSEDGDFIAIKRFPQNHEDIIDMAFSAMPIQQGAMMVARNRLPQDFVWYPNGYKTSEDLDFFFRVFQFGKGANIPDTVLYYRQHGKSLTQAENPKEIFYQAYAVRQRAMREYAVKPSLLAHVLSVIQCTIVTLLPAKLIYPVYYLWRGVAPTKQRITGLRPLFRHIMMYLY